MRRVRRLAMIALLGALAFAQQSKTPVASRSHFRISGTVVNALGGQMLAQTTVFIAPAESRDDTQQVTTGEDGRFSFENVAPGKYTLSAQRRGFAQQSYQQHDLYSTAVVVGPGLISENLLFQLSPDASISGSITDEQNESVRTGRAMLFRSGLQDGTRAIRPWRQVALDDGGRYRFDHLEPGKYFVAVLARPWFAQYVQRSSPREDGDEPAPPAPNPVRGDLDVAYPLTFYPESTDGNGAAAITLAPGDRAVADVTVTSVPSVHLRVTNLADAGNVVLFQPTFDGLKVPLFADSDAAGPGVVEVSGIAPGHFVLQAVGGENSNRQDRELDLSGDQEIDASRRPGSIATIVGTVRLENSKSLPEQLFMRFRNIDSGETFAGPISDKGQFEFRHDLEKAGNYEVELVNQDRTIAVKNISATGAKVQGHTIALVGGSSVHLEILVSKGLGTVNGTVLRDGKPASQCLVLLVPQDALNNRVLFRRDQSDSDGTFTLPNIVPGKYTLVAIQNGWDLEWGNPTVLSPYLKQGQPVMVDSPRTYDIKVKSQ
jgi:Carboxypeptidase regulatory-like domain